MCIFKPTTLLNNKSRIIEVTVYYQWNLLC